MTNSLLSYIRQHSFQFLYYSVLCVFACMLPLFGTHAQTNEVTSPTIVSPSFDQVYTKQQPTITGLSYNDTLIDVYIDGAFNGRATSKNSPSGIASWSYTPFLPLAYGEHEVFTVARNEDETLRSVESTTQVFSVTQPYPTPIIKTIASNSDAFTRPIIAGLALNDAVIEVFIDGSFDGDLSVENDPSGTAHFAYTVSEALLPGWHSVKIRARDAAGKTSDFTHEEVFEVQATTGVSVATAPALTGQPSMDSSVPAAPTLINPEPGTVTRDTQPAIGGLVHNNLSVEVFVDNTYNGETTPVAHESGTTHFVYTPYVPLAPGSHTVYARSVDEYGAKSTHSNTITVLVRPSGAHFVVSPQGVTRVYNGSIAASVSGAQNTQTTKPDGSETTVTQPDTTPEEPVTETEPSKQEEQKEENPVVVSETPEQPTIEPSEPTTPEENIVVEDSPHKGDVIVVDNSATSTTSMAQNKNTSIIIALAIAAIIIIGLISWFTTSKHVEELEEGEENSDDHEQTSEMQLPLDENSETTYEPVWEIEPEPEIEEGRERTDDDHVPPPPPPLNI